MDRVEKPAAYTDTQRMQLRGLLLLAGEIITHYWPMRAFVHHNPLHGLEYLSFEEAARRGHQLLGGRGYLSNALFREYARSGRIRPDHLNLALKPLVGDKSVALGGREVTHLDALRAHLLAGITAPAPASEEATLDAILNRRPDRRLVDALAGHLAPALRSSEGREKLEEPAALGRSSTLAVWCDRTLGTRITEKINREMIKWLEAFLDEDHAAWPMPGREKGFYLAWKSLAALEWSPCRIAGSRQKIARLPATPEDGLLEQLAALGIPAEVRQDYLSLHLTALPGWAGFIKWRAAQDDNAWQQAYPIDLLHYLAARLWYERELVQESCRVTLGIDGTFSAISAYILSKQSGGEKEKERRAALDLAPPVSESSSTQAPLDSQASAASVRERLYPASPVSEDRALPSRARGVGASEDSQQANRRGPHIESSSPQAPLIAAWRLISLAETLEIAPAVLLETAPERLQTIIDWLDRFPESEHGPVWLKALEAGYQEELIDKLSSNFGAHGGIVETPTVSHENVTQASLDFTASKASVREMLDPTSPPGSATQAPLDPTASNASVRGRLHPASPVEGATQAPKIRPQAQAVFCIDVRSEGLRRHLERAGDNETFGFAGFFSVQIRYRALGAHHDIDQFPVLVKAKNVVREIPRAYQTSLLSRHRAGADLLHAGDQLLHDLKENVITPYVMVESVGWFYALPFIGKTIFTAWYRKAAAALHRIFVPPLATALTVDKLSKNDVEEMIASEQRGVIRRALQERFHGRHLNLSLERLEFLRHRALDAPGAGRPLPQGPARASALSTEEENAFVEALRSRYGISGRGTFAQMERITRTGFTLQEQLFTVETALRIMGLTRNFSRLVLFCGHASSSANNPFEAALDCGACGGNSGKPNARVLAAIANKPLVRESLAKNGIVIPPDTYFIAGQHNTTTDEVELVDLEDLPATHRKDVLRLIEDLKEAGRQNSRERCARFPGIKIPPGPSKAARETERRGGDWSQVRPEWGLSSNAAFITGRRGLTKGIDLAGRVFLQSYDYREDPKGRLLEIVMTGPHVVGQWINMEHYFSTVDNEVYGSGSKIYHNVVGRVGVMSGPQSDLRVGLAQQTVMDGARPYHEPMRMLNLIEAPRERISQIIGRHKVLQHLYDNEWVRLMALDPEDKIFYSYIPKQGWIPLPGGPSL